jgi:predicted outer membrane repeat protein
VNGKTRLVRVSASFALCAILLTVPAAFAATITVNSLDDPGAAKICALRDAITAANTKKAVHGCKAGTGDDTITFSVAGTIPLASMLPAITDKDLTISVPVTERITISGQDNVEIMTVASYATLHLMRIELEDGALAYDPITKNDEGGAIWNGGTVTLYNTAFNDNGASAGENMAVGGAIYNVGTLTVTNSTFGYNFATGYGYGGSIFNAGKLTITDSGFNDNSAAQAAAIENNGSDDPILKVKAGTATITSSTFTNNQVQQGDGGGWAGAIDNSGSMTITTSTFSGNYAKASGGAISNDGALTITKSTFTGNSSVGDYCGAGGAIINGGTLNAADSTFVQNSVFTDGFGEDNCSVGAFYNGAGRLTITNSTFYENEADTGAAIYNGGGSLAVVASTFHGDYRDSVAGGGAAIYQYQGSVVAKSTIFADGYGNCVGEIGDSGYNIAADTTCNFIAKGSQSNVNPGLSSAGLANNGGPTETVALVPPSPAIDVIPVADCTTLTGVRITTDQRGSPRPGAGENMCSIGAYEYQD